MASFRAVRRALCTAAEATPTPAPAPAPAGRWQRLKAKAGVWIRSLLSDYKEACKEIVVGARERPLKASVYVGLLGGAYACCTTKPDQSSFQAALLDRSNQLALLSPWIRNAGSNLHVQNLVKLRNHGCLRHLSLGLFSLAYSADHDPDSALYEASCSNLSVPWRELPGRVLDVGFAGRWWVLEKKMEDFDVNETEYKQLPAHMQATAPPSVQEVERNERLHKESWLPIAVQEEETGERTGDGKEDTQVKTVDIQDETPVMETGQIVETVDTKVDSQKVETVETYIDSQVFETVDTNVDFEFVETLDTNMDSQVFETVDTNVDFEFVETLDTNMDSQVFETVDTKVDSQVLETLDTKVDSQKVETVETNNDSQVVETLDTNMDSQVVETLDTNMDFEFVETLDTNMDSQKVETVETNVDFEFVETLDTNMDSHDAETADTSEQAKSGDMKEETLVMDIIDTNVDHREADPWAAEAADIKEDNVNEEVVLETTSAAQD